MKYFRESRVFGYGFQEAENGEFQSSFFTPLFYIFAGMLFGSRAGCGESRLRWINGLNCRGTQRGRMYS